MEEREKKVEERGKKEKVLFLCTKRCCINKSQVDQCLDQSFKHLCFHFFCLYSFPGCFFAAVQGSAEWEQ